MPKKLKKRKKNKYQGGGATLTYNPVLNPQATFSFDPTGGIGGGIGDLSALFQNEELSGLIRGLADLKNSSRASTRVHLNQTDGFYGFQDGGDIGVDPIIVSAIESSMNQSAVSPTGALGLGQITSIALEEFNKQTGKKYTREDMRNDPEKNAEVMNKTLSDILPKQLEAKGLEVNIPNILSAYRQGPTGLKRNGLSELDNERYNQYISAEYLPHDNKLSINRAGKEELLPINSVLGANPFQVGPPTLSLGGDLSHIYNNPEPHFTGYLDRFNGLYDPTGIGFNGPIMKQGGNIGKYQTGDRITRTFKNIPKPFEFTAPNIIPFQPGTLNSRLINRAFELSGDSNTASGRVTGRSKQVQEDLLKILEHTWRENGTPTIEEQVDSTYRANASQSDNTVRVREGNIDDLIAELSHTQQFQDPSRANKLRDFQYDLIVKALREQDPEAPLTSERMESMRDNIAYKTPGTIEYDAHANIQPKLEQLFKKRSDQLSLGRRPFPQLNTQELEPLDKEERSVERFKLLSKERQNDIKRVFSDKSEWAKERFKETRDYFSQRYPDLPFENFSKGGGVHLPPRSHGLLNGLGSFEQGGNMTNIDSIPTNPNGLYEVNGPVRIPSTQLTFEGIDFPVTVVPQGDGSVIEIPHYQQGGMVKKNKTNNMKKIKSQVNFKKGKVMHDGNSYDVECLGEDNKRNRDKNPSGRKTKKKRSSNRSGRRRSSSTRNINIQDLLLQQQALSAILPVALEPLQQISALQQQEQQLNPNNSPGILEQRGLGGEEGQFAHGGEVYDNNVDKAFLGGIGKFLGNAAKGVADFSLSALGAPNVIDNTFIDNSKFLSGVAGIGATIAPFAANALLPGSGALLSAGAGALNNATAGNGTGATQGINGPMPQGYGDFGFQGNQGNQGGQNPMQLLSMLAPLFLQGLSNKEGGHITKRNRMKYREGGFVGIPQDFIPIQTETVKKNGSKLPEQIIWEDGSITDVHASQTHEKMAKKGSSERVTDTPSENSFITSAYGGINITKKDADMIETGLKLEPYSEHSTKGAGKNRDKEPMVMTLADMIFNEKDKGSKKITPAEASDIIKRKLPTRQGYKVGGEYSSDLFMDRTNAMNKGNRLPYLEGIKQISEWEKTKKELNKSKRRLNSALTNFAEDIGVKEILTDDSLQLFQKGGRVGVLDRYKELKSAYTPKAQSGQDLSTLISSAGPLLMQLFGGGKDEQLANGLTQNQMNQLNILRGASGIQGLNASNRLRSAFGDARDLTNQGFDAQRNSRVQGSLLKGLSILGQDPSVDIAGRQGVAKSNIAAMAGRDRAAQQSIIGQSLSALARNPNFDPRQGAGREIAALANSANKAIFDSNLRLDTLDRSQRQTDLNSDFDFDNRLAGKSNQKRTNTNFLNDRLGSEAQGLSNFLGDNQFNRNNTLSNLELNRANSLTNQERAFLQDQLNFIAPGSVQNGVGTLGLQQQIDNIVASRRVQPVQQIQTLPGGIQQNQVQQPAQLPGQIGGLNLCPNGGVWDPVTRQCV